MSWQKASAEIPPNGKDISGKTIPLPPLFCKQKTIAMGYYTSDEIVISFMSGGHPLVTQQGSFSVPSLYLYLLRHLTSLCFILWLFMGYLIPLLGHKLLEGQSFALPNHFHILHNT